MGKYDAGPPGRRRADARPECIANVSDVEAEPYDRAKDGIAGSARDIGEATGARLLGIDVTEIPPGKKSSHLHSHSHKEEFFFVLSGRCRIRLGEAEHELGPGDAVSRPAGTGVPHQFLNPYAEPCRVMMLGIMAGRGVEDTVDWPEIGRALVIDPDGNRKVVRTSRPRGA
jgi:uncharacterized cupin superfamily protein